MLFCSLGLLGLGELAAAQDARSGTVKEVVGTVSLVQGTATRAAKPGEAISATDKVVTGRDGNVSMVLRDGTVMSIGPNSQINLSQFRYDSTTQQGNILVNVLQGSMRMITGLIAKVSPQDVKVTTPTSVVGVRGTDFIVEVK